MSDCGTNLPHMFTARLHKRPFAETFLINVRAKPNVASNAATSEKGGFQHNCFQLTNTPRIYGFLRLLQHTHTHTQIYPKYTQDHLGKIDRNGGSLTLNGGVWALLTIPSNPGRKEFSG